MASKRRQPDAAHPVLRQMAERGIYSPNEFEAWLAARNWAWQGIENGAYGITLEDALFLFVFEDPVRWCETYLIEPDTGEPWKFFDYQRESLRAWRQDVIHQDGAEVGKTREIVCMVLWGECTCMGLTVARPWMLIGAPQQTHLDEIILAVEGQVGAQDDGGAKGSLLSHFWRKPKRTPHVMHRFTTLPLAGEAPGEGRVYYRPAGHDGEAFRGVHVNALLLMDEAAKLKASVQWTEFWRSAKPGCHNRVYSVPDGDRSTEFYRLTQQAVIGLPEERPGWRLFNWPKTIMPAPFWSEARDAQFVKLFGSRQSPGYVRNVLGQWGDAENPVFGWELLRPNLMDLPDFRILKLHADRSRGEMAVTLVRIELQTVEGKRVPVEHTLIDTVQDLAPVVSGTDEQRRSALRAVVDDCVYPRQLGVYWAGVDFGETHDPTEIIVSSEIHPRLRDELRVQAQGLPYAAQAELIYLIDAVFGQLPHWGADLGAAGTAVVRDLQMREAYADARFDERMTGFQFASLVDCIGEDGEPLIDQSKDNGETVLRAPAKHWATQAMVARLQQQGFGLAHDQQALDWMTSHTAREGAKWPIYAKKNDHTIDARRVQMLRKLYDDTLGDLDVFASGAHLR